MFKSLIKALGGIPKEDFINKVEDCLYEVNKRIYKNLKEDLQANRDKMDHLFEKLQDNTDKLSGDIFENYQNQKDILGIQEMILDKFNHKDITKILPEDRFQRCYDEATKILESENKEQQLQELKDRRTYKDCIILKMVKEKQNEQY